MQHARAVTKYMRISPRKARLAAGIIRGLEVEKALSQLRYSSLKGSRLLMKTLKSAIANAETQLALGKEQLRIHEVRVDKGPTMKRAKSKNRGGRVPVLKRMSHFSIILSEK
jgi:large subunit ribosomal protein L22